MTTAIVIYIGANRESKRVAIVNILYNLGKSIMVLAVITIIHQIGLLNGLWDAVVNSGMIANTNTVFNLVCAICLLPMIRVFERLSDRIVRQKKEEKDPHSELIEGLNPVFFSTPAIALQSCYDVLQKMFHLSRENIGRAQTQLKEYSAPMQEEITAQEMQVDRLTDNLSRYLVKLLPHLQGEDHISVLNQYYKLSTEFERLGDQAVNIADIAAKLFENNTDFSETFKKEIAVLQELIRDMNNSAIEAPWKKSISPIVTSCGNLYTTADGKDLLFEMVSLLVYSYRVSKDIIVAG